MKCTGQPYFETKGRPTVCRPSCSARPTEVAIAPSWPEREVTAENLGDACSFGRVSLWLGIFQTFSHDAAVWPQVVVYMVGHFPILRCN